MSRLAAYLGLATLPFVYTQVPNPVWIWWHAKTRGRALATPMPPDVANKAERVGRYMLFPMEALVAGSVLSLMVHFSITPVQIGVRLQDWESDVLVGCAAGLSWGALPAMSFYFFPAVRRQWAVHYLQKGSVSFWVFIFLVGVFAEELWRAFCLIGLTSAGHSLGLSVILTAVAFALAHKLRLGGTLALGILGAGLALLYVWRASLAAPYSAHLIANLSGLYWIRRARLTYDPASSVIDGAVPKP